MPVQFWLYFLFILLFEWPFALSDTKTASPGPYKASIVSVKDCETPSRPCVKELPVTFKAMVYNTTDGKLLMSGNLTVSQDTRNFKVRLKSMVKENNQWRLAFLINDIGCHNILMGFFSTSFGVKYDRKTCRLLKGHYPFTNLDVNSIQHLFASKLDYGEMIWRTELFSQQVGTYFCYEFETLTEPI